MSTYKLGDDIYEVQSELIEVTSLHRPDVGWHYVDAQGHEHRWWIVTGSNSYANATSYKAGGSYSVITLRTMHDGWEYFEDGERIELTHLECKLCGERVKPGYTADDTPQYIQGIRRCTINGVSVSKEEFERRLKAATEGSI